MAFSIPQAQQKVFIENFMKQVLDVALDLVKQGKDRGSPGETIHAVATAVIRQLYSMQEDEGDEGPSGPQH